LSATAALDHGSMAIDDSSLAFDDSPWLLQEALEPLGIG
jgi:hypothetical protein